MPNYVTNIVNIIGPAEQRKKLLEEIAFDGMPGTFDFNKVIPMPESLNLEESTLAEKYIDAYLSSINPESHSSLAPEQVSAESFEELLKDARECRDHYEPNPNLNDEQIIEIVRKGKDKTPESIINLGRQYLTNYQMHGATTWYDWRVENWGTKWNNTPELSVVDKGTGNLCFDTAWSMPEPLFVELSRQFPGLTLDVSWADEDIGYNVGNREYRNGEMASEYIPEFGTDEAEEMAFDIKGFAGDTIVLDPVSLGDLIKEAQSRVEEKQQPAQDVPKPGKHQNQER